MSGFFAPVTNWTWFWVNSISETTPSFTLAFLALYIVDTTGRMCVHSTVYKHA
jgi:hypothetical protein